MLIVRERRHCWSSGPGNELLIASMATIAGFSLLGVYGIIVPQLTPFEVLFTFIFSAAFALSVDIPKYYAFRRLGL